MNDDSDDDALLLYVLRRRMLLRRRRRRQWVHDINRGRVVYGEYYTLVQELKQPQNEDRFYEYFRMNHQTFEELVRLIGPSIRRTGCNFRRPISEEERVCITLRFLATGDSFGTIAFNYRVGKSTVSSIVLETCRAIWESLSPIYMRPPLEDDWRAIARRFHQRWNFPNCIGAIDGKHVVMHAPPNSGAQWFNYKGTFSLVLLALVDADYCFSIVDIGGYGRNSDGGIFAHSAMGRGLSAGTLNVPADQPIPGAPRDIGSLPFVVVGDEAFPLKTNLMRPFPGKHLPDDQRIYNYRHSRARRISENAFGILTSRFRVYQRRIQLDADNVIEIVKATTALHNFLQRDAQQNPQRFAGHPNDPRGLLAARNIGGNRAAMEAFDVRERFKAFFNSQAGSVPWQRDIVNNVRQ